MGIFDADGFLPFEQDTPCKRFGLQFQVGAREYRLQEGDRGAATLAVADGELRARKTFLLGRIIVRRVPIPCHLRGFDPGIEQRITVGRLHYREVAGASTIFRIGITFPGFVAAEIRQDIVVPPAGGAFLGPAIEIFPMAAHIGHDVDGR